MRKQLFIPSSGPFVDRRDGPSSSILLDGAAGDYFKSTTAWLPAGSGNIGAQNASWTIHWWAKNTRPEGDANDAGLWTIWAVASDELGTENNFIDGHDACCWSMHCIDDGDGLGRKIRLHIRNPFSLTTDLTGNNEERGDTQVYSYDDNVLGATPGAGRFDDLFDDGEWHLYTVTIYDAPTQSGLFLFDVQFFIDEVEIDFSDAAIRNDDTATDVNRWFDPGTNSVLRYPLKRELSSIKRRTRLWMGTLYGDDGLDGGKGAMSMQLYDIVYADGYGGGSRGWNVDRPGVAHGATEYLNTSFNGHYYEVDNDFNSEGGFFTYEHFNNKTHVVGADIGYARCWWRPGLDKNNIGKDYLEYLGAYDTDQRLFVGGGENFDDSNAIRYSPFEVNGMTASSIRRDAPGGFGDDSSILLDGDAGDYFKSDATLSTSGTSTLIWWAKNTSLQGNADSDGLWTVFSVGTGLGDENGFSMHRDNNNHLTLRVWNNEGEPHPLRSQRTMTFDVKGTTTGQFDELFNDGEWHMYAVALNSVATALTGAQFSVDGVGIPWSAITPPAAVFTRGNFLSSPRLWMGTNFGGATVGAGSMSMQLYSIIYASSFSTYDKLNSFAYRENGDVVDNHWPAFNSERYSYVYPFSGFGQTTIPPINWWRPGYDEDNIGKDYIGSADFTSVGMIASDIRRDYPKPKPFVGGPYSSVVMDGTRFDVITRAFNNWTSSINGSSTIIWWAKNTTHEGTADSGEIDHTIWLFGASLGAKNSFSIGRTSGHIIISVFNDWATEGEKDERVIQYNDVWDEHFDDGEWHMYAVSIEQDDIGAGPFLKKLEFSVDGVLITPDSGGTFGTSFSRDDHSVPKLWIGNASGGGFSSSWTGLMNMQLYSLITCSGYITPTELSNIAYNSGDPVNNDFPGENADIGSSGTKATHWLRPGFNKNLMFKDHAVNGASAATGNDGSSELNGVHSGGFSILIRVIDDIADGPTARDIRPNDYPEPSP